MARMFRRARREDLRASHGFPPVNLPPAEFICPVCVQEITAKDIFIVRDGGEPDVPLSEFIEPTSPAERARFDAQNPRREHHRLSADPAAVSTPCALPRGFGDRPSYIVGLVGVDKTSKSHLIHAMVRALDSAPLYHFGYTFRLDRLSRHDFENWYGFADQHKPVPMTPLRELRTITLVVRYQNKSANIDRSLNLVLVETAGEHFFKEAEIALNAPYAYAADAYLYLVPPDSITTMPVIDDNGRVVKGDATYSVTADGEVKLRSRPGNDSGEVRTAGKLFDEWQRRGKGTTDVLDPLAEIIEGRKNDVGPAALRNPLFGVVLTKVDLLELHLPQTSRSTEMADLWRDVDYSCSAEELQLRIENDGKRIRQFLQDQKILQIGAKVDAMGIETEFFSVAATGEPQNDNGMFPTASPRRVLDPIVWILSHLSAAEVL